MMRRDMEKVRTLLLQVARRTDAPPLDMTERELSYHLYLIRDVGLAQTDSGNTSLSLTWKGCDFLDKISSPEKWGEIKDILNRKNLPLSQYNIELAHKKLFEGGL